MSNLVGNLVISAALTAAIMFFVIIIGRLIDKLDNFLINKMASVTGRGIARFILNRVLFMGTVFHELSHALFAKISGAKVTKIRCFVLFSKDTLGYVSFTPQGNPASQAMQSCLTSCAPVLTAFVTVPLFSYLALTYSGGFLWNLVFGYCAISALCHASMSDVDLDLYKKGAICVYPMLVLLVFALRGLFF